MLGGRVGVVRRYADWLAGPGVERGLLGPRESPRLWERHLLNCAVVADLVPQRSTVADVGSGAGLPGLVLALCRPDLEVTLIEPLLRRVRFLDEVVSDLVLENVEVRRARAEELPGSSYDVVTSRAVAPLPRLAEWCLPLVRSGGGEMLAIKGERAALEVAEASGRDWGAVGCSEPEVVECGAGTPYGPVSVVRVRRESDRRVRWSGSAEASAAGRRGRTSGRGRRK